MARPALSPITRKRVARFKGMKRAYWSLVILALLYGISLCSELIANDTPLFVRFQGESYFPVFRFHPEDTFLQNGRNTRPDYKKIAKSPAFAGNPKNFMVFAPIPYGPYESVNPKSIPVPDEVTVRISPVPRLGSVNLLPDFTIQRGVSAGVFFDTQGHGVRGLDFKDYYPVPREMADAVAARFANRESAAVDFPVQALKGGGRVMLSLSTYRERPRAPRSIRVTLKEPEDPSARPVFVVVGPDGNLKKVPGQIWPELPEKTRKRLLSLAAQRFQERVEPEALDVDGKSFEASFDKPEVRFPYPPTAGHPLGIDDAGRDVLVRILYGFRTSMSFGIILVLSSMILGTLAGALQGYYGGILDISAQRMIEIWSAIPFLYVMIFLGSVYGRSFLLLLIVYALFNWIGISYYMRAEFLRLRKEPFVEAAQCLGIPTGKILYRHILPNALVPLVTLFPFYLVTAVSALAALDYLGFGLPPPTPSWGELLQQAQQYRWAWWLIVYPALALFLVMLLGVFVGEGLRNAFDPKKYARIA